MSKDTTRKDSILKIIEIYGDDKKLKEFKLITKNWPEKSSEKYPSWPYVPLEMLDMSEIPKLPNPEISLAKLLLDYLKEKDLLKKYDLKENV